MPGVRSLNALRFLRQPGHGLPETAVLRWTDEVMTILDDPDCAASRACFACVNAIPLACGQTRSGDSTDTGDRLHGYDCSDLDESGGEVVVASVLLAFLLLPSLLHLEECVV